MFSNNVPWNCNFTVHKVNCLKPAFRCVRVCAALAFHMTRPWLCVEWNISCSVHIESLAVFCRPTRWLWASSYSSRVVWFRTTAATALDRNCIKSRALLREVYFFFYFNRNWIGMPCYNYICSLTEMKLYDGHSTATTKSMLSVSEHVHVRNLTTELLRLNVISFIYYIINNASCGRLF
jgi:hypothetical protein